jgi:hypothetical protein
MIPYQQQFLIPFIILKFLGITMVLFAWWKRKTYPPIAAKQLVPITLSLIAATFWLVGRLYSYGMFGFDGIFQYCHFWKYFCQCCLGVNLYLSVFIFRFRRLYYIMILKKPIESWSFWLPIALPVVVAVIIITVPLFVFVHSTDISWNLYGYKIYCLDSKPYYSSSIYLVVLVQASLIISHTLKLAKVRKAVNEVRFHYFIF